MTLSQRFLAAVAFDAKHLQPYFAGLAWSSPATEYIIAEQTQGAKWEAARLIPIHTAVAEALEALERFARIEADDGDDFEGVHEDIILRVECTAGDIQSARSALARLGKVIGEGENAT